MIMRSITYDYHDWMCNLMNTNLPAHRNYQLLLRDLDNKPFIVVHPLDKNRELDGHFLREDYLAEMGRDPRDIWEDTSSVLEVLVSMSIRIETEITGELGNDHIEKWFWVMIKNLGLDFYTDDNYNSREVDNILDIWLCRKFKSNGHGSIFPLKKVTQDQRDLDIWYQMQLYLNENWQF